MKVIGTNFSEVSTQCKGKVEKVAQRQPALFSCAYPSTQQANNKAAIYLFIIFFTFLLLQMYIIPLDYEISGKKS